MILIDNKTAKEKAIDMARLVIYKINKFGLREDGKECISCGEKISEFYSTKNKQDTEIFLCRRCIPLEVEGWYRILFDFDGMTAGDFIYKGKKVTIAYHGDIPEDIYGDEWKSKAIAAWVYDCLRHEEDPNYSLDQVGYFYFAEKRNRTLYTMQQPGNIGKIYEDDILYDFSARLIAVKIFMRSNIFPIDITDLENEFSRQPKEIRENYYPKI